jgi:hypothetical protein
MAVSDSPSLFVESESTNSRLSLFREFQVWRSPYAKPFLTKASRGALSLMTSIIARAIARAFPDVRKAEVVPFRRFAKRFLPSTRSQTAPKVIGVSPCQQAVSAHATARAVPFAPFFGFRDSPFHWLAQLHTKLCMFSLAINLPTTICHILLNIYTLAQNRRASGVDLLLRRENIFPNFPKR